MGHSICTSHASPPPKKKSTSDHVNIRSSMLSAFYVIALEVNVIAALVTMFLARLGRTSVAAGEKWQSYMIMNQYKHLPFETIDC